MFYLGCQWLTTVLVVRLSPDYGNPGAFAFAMAGGIVFASIGLYKIRTFQVSDLSGEYTNREYVGFRLVTIVLGALVLAVYLPLAAPGNAALLSASAAYLIFKGDEVFSDVLYGIYQRNARMDYIGRSQLLRGVLSLAGFSAPLALTGSLVAGILGMAACCMAVTVLYDIPHAKLFGPVRPSLAKAQMAGLFKACLLAMLASLCANSIVSLVRQYFGIAYGSEALGIYASVATPAVLIQVAATYLYSPLIGSLAETHLNEGEAAFRKRFLVIFAAIAAVVGMFIALLSTVGDYCLQLVFGPSIAPYTYLFPYVLIATGCMGLLLYVNDVLIVLRKMRVTLLCNVVALAATLGLAVPLTASLGMNGINASIIAGSLIAVLCSMPFIMTKQK